MRGITSRSHVKEYRSFTEAGILPGAEASHLNLLYGPVICLLIYLLWQHNRRLALERRGAKKSIFSTIGRDVYVPGLGEGEELLGSLRCGKRRDFDQGPWCR